MMKEEWLRRWRCPHCGYITFVKPHNGECPACDWDHEYRDIEEREEK